VPTVEGISGDTPASAADRARAELRQTAREVTGQIFFGTLLRQLRSSTLKGEYGHGGRGEEIFQAQLDQILAERAGRGTDTDIADALVRRYEKRAVSAAEYRQQMREMSQQAQDDPVGRQAENVEVHRW